jgi:cytochrome P450
MLSFLLSDDVRRNPFAWYDELRRLSPVARDPRSGTWMLFDYDSVKRAMSDPETFSSRVSPPTGRAPDWLVFQDPPRHTLLRALVSRAFAPRAIAELEPRIRALSTELLDAALTRERRDEMDLVADYAEPLPVLVIAELFGIPSADWPSFRRWSRAIVNLSYAIAGGEAAMRAVREHGPARLEMMAYLTRLVAERRAAPRDDVLSRLAAAEVDGQRLTDEEILGFFQLLLSAATETTTNLIDNAMLCFLEHPEQRARVVADRMLLPSAIEEVVRFRSPGQIMFRQTTRDVTLHGQTIPADSFVLVVVGSANRDPLRFAHADRFDVARDPNPHVAFGHGIHFCLGAALARLEARVALGDLLDRIDDVALADDTPWPPREALHVHGPAHLHVRFTLRGAAARS